MNTTIWYTITDEHYSHCDKPMVFTRVAGNDAGLIAEAIARELAFVTGLDAEAIKVWVE